MSSAVDLPLTERRAFVAFYVEHDAALRQFLARRSRDPDHADDVAQELWLRAYEHWPALVQRPAPHRWLFRTARNLLATSRRLAATEQRKLADWAVQGFHCSEITNAVAQQDLDDAIESLVLRLPPKQYTAFRARECQAQSYAKIAKAMKIKESTARVHVLQARRALQKAAAELDALRLAMYDPPPSQLPPSVAWSVAIPIDWDPETDGLAWRWLGPSQEAPPVRRRCGSTATAEATAVD